MTNIGRVLEFHAP